MTNAEPAQLLDSRLAIHPYATAHLQRFISHPSHALLLLGPEGTGKYHLALLIIQKLLSLADVEAVSSYPYITFVTPEKDKNSIGIEAIRELQHITSLRLPGKVNDRQSMRRFIIIPEAHSLTVEAQNALLKLLEEPPQDTCFILTASSEQTLLITIRSRVQQLTVQRPLRADLESLFWRPRP